MYKTYHGKTTKKNYCIIVSEFWYPNIWIFELFTVKLFEFE